MRRRNPPPFPVVTLADEIHRQRLSAIHEAIKLLIEDPSAADTFELHIGQKLAHLSAHFSLAAAQRMLSRHLAGYPTSRADEYVLRRELHNIANMLGPDEVEMLVDDALAAEQRMATGEPVHHARANPEANPGFVRTAADERLWQRAQDAAARTYPVGSDSYWRVANMVFHRMKESHRR